MNSETKPVSGLRLWLPITAVIGIVSISVLASYTLAVRDSDIRTIKDAVVLLRENQREISTMVRDNIKAQVELQRIVDRLGFKVEALEGRFNNGGKASP